MRRFAIACLICLIAPQPALAGAWLRDKGNGFMSISSTIRALSPIADYETSLYADFGLTARLTAGLDVNETPGVGGHALAFLRLPISASGARRKLALELGIGGHHRREIWHPMYRVALSLGYGFTGWFGPGWLAVDTAIEHRGGHAEPLFKLDATIGLSSSDQIRPMLQLETAIAQNLSLQWTLTPSLMIAGKGKSTWIIGIQQRSFGAHRMGLKVALWRRF